MTLEQKGTYCVFKFIIKESNCCHLASTFLPSYYLKTVFLWALEKIPVCHWTEDQYGSRVLDLLDDLIGRLNERCLPHFFVPDLNLFDGIKEEDCKVIVKEVVSCRQHTLREHTPVSLSSPFSSATDSHTTLLLQFELQFELDEFSYIYRPIIDLLDDLKPYIGTECYDVHRKYIKNIRANILSQRYPTITYDSTSIVSHVQRTMDQFRTDTPILLLLNNFISTRYKRYIHHNMRVHDVEGDEKHKEEVRTLSIAVCDELFLSLEKMSGYEAIHHFIKTKPFTNQKWRKRINDQCSLCGIPQTLHHVLGGCPVMKDQGRYTWQHNAILQYLSQVVMTSPEYKEGHIKVNVTLPSHQHTTIPVHTPPHSGCPDLVIYSPATKKASVVQLVILCDTDVDISYAVTDKSNKECHIDDLIDSGYQCNVYCLEIGVQGLITEDNVSVLQKISCKLKLDTNVKDVCSHISKLALLPSYVIFQARDTLEWTDDECQSSL